MKYIPKDCFLISTTIISPRCILEQDSSAEIQMKLSTPELLVRAPFIVCGEKQALLECNWSSLKIDSYTVDI